MSRAVTPACHYKRASALLSLPHQRLLCHAPASLRAYKVHSGGGANRAACHTSVAALPILSLRYTAATAAFANAAHAAPLPRYHPIPHHAAPPPSAQRVTALRRAMTSAYDVARTAVGCEDSKNAYCGDMVVSRWWNRRHCCLSDGWRTDTLRPLSNLGGIIYYAARISGVRQWRCVTYADALPLCWLHTHRALRGIGGAAWRQV